jgi:LemA protein
MIIFLYKFIRGLMFLLLFLIVLVIALVIWLIATYNSLVTFRNRVDNAWSQIDVQLQRRFDLIPNLVETVKGYMEHEKEVFENIAQARANMVGAKTVVEKGEASSQLTNTLNTLFAVSENYPELKANENFIQLQQEIKGTEDKIAFSRQFYNDTVTRYNSKIDMFPTNIFASSMNLTKREYFAIENQEARQNVKVQF